MAVNKPRSAIQVNANNLPKINNFTEWPARVLLTFNIKLFFVVVRGDLLRPCGPCVCPFVCLSGHN